MVAQSKDGLKAHAVGKGGDIVNVHRQHRSLSHLHLEPFDKLLIVLEIVRGRHGNGIGASLFVPCGKAAGQFSRSRNGSCDEVKALSCALSGNADRFHLLIVGKDGELPRAAVDEKSVNAAVCHPVEITVHPLRVRFPVFKHCGGRNKYLWSLHYFISQITLSSYSIFTFLP